MIEVEKYKTLKQSRYTIRPRYIYGKIRRVVHCPASWEKSMKIARERAKQRESKKNVSEEELKKEE